MVLTVKDPPDPRARLPPDIVNDPLAAMLVVRLGIVVFVPLPDNTIF